MPINGTFKEKFGLNCIGHDDGNDVVCIRILRAKTFNVVVLYARRDISEGEEICINYQVFNDISQNTCRTVKIDSTKQMEYHLSA